MGVYYDGRFANKELSAEEADKLFLKAKDDTEKAEQLKQQEKKMAKKEQTENEMPRHKRMAAGEKIELKKGGKVEKKHKEAEHKKKK